MDDWQLLSLVVLARCAVERDNYKTKSGKEEGVFIYTTFVRLMTMRQCCTGLGAGWCLLTQHLTPSAIQLYTSKSRK